MRFDCSAFLLGDKEWTMLQGQETQAEDSSFTRLKGQRLELSRLMRLNFVSHCHREEGARYRRVFLSLCWNTKLFCIHEWDYLCWAMKNYLASLSWIIPGVHTGSRIVYGVGNERGEAILKFLFLFMLLLGCLCNKLTIINHLCLPCRYAAPKQLQGSL